MNLSIRGGHPGFTLVELLIVIVVLAIGLTIAVPSLQEFLKNNRVAAQNNELVALISLAKSQAIRLNENWQVELISDGFSWAGNVRPADRNPTDAEEEGCPDEVGVVRCSSFQNVELLHDDGTKTAIEFNNRGFLELESQDWASVDLVLEHRNCKGGRQKRLIEILPTGQITSLAVPCS